MSTVTAERKTPTRPTTEAVRRATGRGWEEWLATLDAAGAAEWDHKAIVAHLEREHPAVSGWWRQTLAVGYERARGKRAVGQTATTGFQLGVQRTVPITRSRAWDLVVSRPDLWLGEGASVAFEKGERYEVPANDLGPAATGEIRVVRPGERLRLTWHPEGWEGPATIQLTPLEAGPGKTAIHLHLEKLPDAQAREEMRGRWREALERLVAAAA